MARADRELTATDQFYGEEGSFARSDTRRNAAKALGESPAAQELAMNPTLVAACEERLLPWCKKIVLGTTSAITVEPPDPGTEAQPHQVMHRDDGMWAVSQWPLEDESKRPDLCISCMWALTDFTAGNGATRAKKEEFCIKNKKLCIKNEKLCIKTNRGFLN